MTWPSQGRPNQIRIIWLHLRPSYYWNVKRNIIMLFMKEIELWMSCPFEQFPEENVFSSLPSWQWKMFYVHVFFRAKKFTGWLADSKRNSPRQKPRRRLPSWKRCRFCLFFLFWGGITVDDQLRETASTTTPRRQPLGSNSPAPSAGQPQHKY